MQFFGIKVANFLSWLFFIIASGLCLEKNPENVLQEHDELNIIFVGLINLLTITIIIPNKNINSVKKAIAPKISPVIPPKAFLDFRPIIQIMETS